MTTTFQCRLCQSFQSYEPIPGTSLKPNICDHCDERWLNNLKLFPDQLELCAKVATMNDEKHSKVLTQWRMLSERNQIPGQCARDGQLTSSQCENAKRYDMMVAEVLRLT